MSKYESDYGTYAVRVLAQIIFASVLAFAFGFGAAYFALACL